MQATQELEMGLRQRVETHIALRQHNRPGAGSRVVTVRLPRELHEALKERARQERLSMNRLAVLAFEEAVAALSPAEQAEPNHS